MASRTLTVEVVGQTRKFVSAMRSVDTSVDGSSKKFDRLGKVGKAAFSGLGLAAGAVAATGLKQAADAAIEAEKTQARLEAQLKASGIAYKSHADHIDNVIGKVSRLSGLDDEDLTDSFTNIVRVTGNVNQSLKLTGLAADFARAKHMDVAKAGELVGKVAGGNTGILGRYGIKIKEGATATEALGKMHEKFRGQAKAYGDTTQGGMDKASVAWENLLEIVGEKIAPVIRKAAELLTGLFDKTSKGNRILRKVGDAYMDWLGIVRDVVRKVANAVGNWVDKNREQINDVIRAFKRIGNFIKDIVLEVIIPMIKKIAPIVRDFAEKVADLIGDLVKLVSDLINGDWKEAWADFKEIVTDLVKDIPRIMGRLLKAFGQGLDKLKKKVGEKGEELGNKLIDGMIAGVKDKGPDLAEKILDYLPTPDNLVKKGTEIGKSIIEGVGDVTEQVAASNPAAWGGGSRAPGGVGGNTSGLQSEARNGFAWLQQKYGGLTLSSGYRSPAENAAVGGAVGSDHLTGLATDIVPSDGWNASSIARLDQIAGWAASSPLIRWIGWRGVEGHGPYDHLHLSWMDRVAGDVTAKSRGVIAGGGVRRGVGDVTGINFSPAQIKFAVAAASASGLDPRVIAAWMNREFNGYRKTDTRGKYNFMSVGYTDSGDMGWLGNAVNDPTTAGRATGLWLTGKLKGAPKAAAGIQAIADTAGGSIRSQVKAIIDSPWASGHYFYNYGDFAASAAGISGFGKVDGGSPGAGGGGGGTAKNPARARWEAAQKRVKGKAGDAVEAARNEALTGGGALELSVARAQTLQARATSKDDLAGLIKGLKQERDVKRRRLRRVRKLLKRKHRLGRKNRVALLNEEAQLLADIGDLSETIKEYKADQKGGATTVSRAEELDAGVDPNAADTGDAGGGGADTSAADEAQAARDAVNAEIAGLLASINANQTAIKRLAEQQGPQMVAALMAAYNGDIGAKVAGQLQTTGYYAGSGARY